MTHAQEILARMMGHRSRHSFLEKINNKESIENPFVEEASSDFFYYEVHVFYSTRNGFSVFFRDRIYFEMEDDVITKAYDLGLIDQEDMDHVDYVDDSMSKDDYEKVIGVSTGDRNTECSFCEQHYQKDFLQLEKMGLKNVNTVRSKKLSLTFQLTMLNSIGKLMM